jgi:hypothetical protein
MLARCGVEHRLQVRMHGDGQGRGGLFLLYGKHAVANVLAAHAQDIAAPLCGVEQQREREAQPPSRTETSERPAVCAIQHTGDGSANLQNL